MPDPFVLSIGLTLVVWPASRGNRAARFSVYVLQRLVRRHIQHPRLCAANDPDSRDRLRDRRRACRAAWLARDGCAGADADPRRAAGVPDRRDRRVAGPGAWPCCRRAPVAGNCETREGGFRMARRGSYSAWSVCNSGLSSSIALSQASHGNALNLVEKATGQVIPLSQTVFAPFVFDPTCRLVVVMTAIFIWMHPKPEHVVTFNEPRVQD